MSEESGENYKMIQRYIWLARLNDDLLALVDNKQLGGGFTDTGSGEFYVSTDGNDWGEPVGRFTMKQNTDKQVFGIIPTTGRYVKIRILSSYRDQNCSLSEVYAYGK